MIYRRSTKIILSAITAGILMVGCGSDDISTA